MDTERKPLSEIVTLQRLRNGQSISDIARQTHVPRADIEAQASQALGRFGASDLKELFARTDVQAYLNGE